MGKNDKKEVSKSALNNIFQPDKPLPRAEAIRRYQSLSPEAREEVNRWVNNRYTFNREVPSHMKNIKLDTNNSQHKKYVEIWLKERDHVLSNKSNLEWERSARTRLNTSYFSKDIAPTPKEVLIKSQGILEMGLDGKGFKKHVTDRLQEATTYSGEIGRRGPERRIALMIATKLFENDVWVQNAGSSREGRDALRILSGLIGGFINESEVVVSSKDKEILGKISNILKPYRGETTADRGKNIKAFKEGFPKLSAQIQKNLEAQGYQVEKVYYRNFTNNTIEIRASVTKETKVYSSAYDTYGYRGDTYTPMTTIKEKKEMSVGGLSTASGRFINASYFNKHGTIETDWDTQLALGELAVLAGVGIRTALYGIRSVLIKASKTGIKELGEDIIETSVKKAVPENEMGRFTREAIDDLPYAKTAKMERAKVDPFSDTQLDTAAPTKPVGTPNALKESEPVQISVRPERKPADFEIKKTSITRNGGHALQTREQNIDTLGMEAYEKASKMGMDDFSLGKYIDEIQTREVLLPTRFDKLDEVTQKIVKQIDDTWSLGETNAKKLIAYGYDPRDISMHMEGLASKGLSKKQVWTSIEQEIKLHDYYRNTYCGGKFDLAKTQLTDSLGAGGDVRDRLASKIHEKMWNDWKASDPRKLQYDYLSTKVRNDKMGQLFDEAKEIAKGIEKSVLGTTGAETPIFGGLIAGAAIPLKRVSRETKKETDSIPKIREKHKKTNELKEIKDNKKFQQLNSKTRTNF